MGGVARFVLLPEFFGVLHCGVDPSTPNPPDGQFDDECGVSGGWQHISPPFSDVPVFVENNQLEEEEVRKKPPDSLELQKRLETSADVHLMPASTIQTDDAADGEVAIQFPFEVKLHDLSLLLQ